MKKKHITLSKKLILRKQNVLELNPEKSYSLLGGNSIPLCAATVNYTNCIQCVPTMPVCQTDILHCIRDNTYRNTCGLVCDLSRRITPGC